MGQRGRSDPVGRGEPVVTPQQIRSIKRFAEMAKRSTPGPWKFLPKDGCFIVAQDKGAPQIVAEVDCYKGHKPDGELIAAAPSMAAMLEAFLTAGGAASLRSHQVAAALTAVFDRHEVLDAYQRKHIVEDVCALLCRPRVTSRGRAAQVRPRFHSARRRAG